jgi:TRAP-type mannitol/chloroaromatic compound transport system permease small subunit
MNGPAKHLKASDVVDRFILRIGRLLAWANGLLVLVIVLQVTLRYGFGRGMVALEELEWHLYSVAFMFGLSYAVVTDAHVRVDLVSSFLSRRTREWIEILGIVFLLLPFIAVVIIFGLEFLQSSWVRNERSLAPMGLPYRWAIKAVIPASFAFFAAAALSRLYKAVAFLREKSDANK